MEGSRAGGEASRDSRAPGHDKLPRPKRVAYSALSAEKRSLSNPAAGFPSTDGQLLVVGEGAPDLLGRVGEAPLEPELDAVAFRRQGAVFHRFLLGAGLRRVGAGASSAMVSRWRSSASSRRD
jgi:hypothetical protein